MARRLVVRRGAGGNCTYDEGAKRELIEVCLRGGHSVAEVARTYGLNTNQLHNWIALFRKTRGDRSSPRPEEPAVSPASAFIPVVTLPRSPASSHGLQLHLILTNGIRADLGPLRREDVMALLTELAGLGTTRTPTATNARPATSSSKHFRREKRPSPE